MKPLALLLALAATACASTPSPDQADRFFQQLRGLCGQAFAGRVVEDWPTPSPDFAGRHLVMRVGPCRAGEVRIPFQVGEDRSRTWIVTRTAAGLRLKHDHRHADGTPDRVTNYGGDALGGTAARQSFPADAETRALLAAVGNTAGVENVWSLELGAEVFAYELARPGRRFRAEFDLTRPLPTP